MVGMSITGVVPAAARIRAMNASRKGPISGVVSSTASTSKPLDDQTFSLFRRQRHSIDLPAVP
jgi:hypothetical protein